MILGIGIDLIDIRRIEKTLNRFGNRFINRIFTDVEQKKSNQRKLKAASYAKRFAAKEAMAKALGTGISRGVYWRDIGIINNSYGKPDVILTGAAKKRLDRICQGKRNQIHLTLTDDFPYAQAYIIIEVIED